ncbi:MAG: 3-oxoacyl-[acyl-carrier protein] reductase [Granulosicoccus sp.]|jgi:3-oxoacyl-[acyl-carrier protein] reductase
MPQQVALVTGAGRGIGRATALALADASFSVAVNDWQANEEVDSLVSEIQARGGNACQAIFDVSDLSTHKTALVDIERTLGPLTTLVNNAGVGVLSRGDPLDVCEDSFDRCINVNTKALFFLSQAFAKRLLARDRDPECAHSIVNITSSNAIAVAVNRSEYCVSKSAAAMISKCFAVRLGSENISVYDVQPGLIETRMTAAVINTYKERAADGICLLPRVGQAAEVGLVVANLAKNVLPYTTGQVISVDGGMLVPRF